MKKIPQTLDDTLMNYLDGSLKSEEKAGLEKLLDESDMLRSRLDELRIIHFALIETKPDEPSKNFTQLVMGKLDGYVERSTFPIRNGIFLLAGILAAVGIVALLVSAGVFDQTQTVIDLNKINIPKQYIQQTLPAISINGKVLINIIVVLNLGLAWLVLDRAILKPYFERRMQTR
ncbi:MAG TPA: hypothetical protein PLJ60_10980 [Chryseolinea sp.]|nr:hypothetical protein [Chryseolinea sp.]HPH46903.1 hypothetical protein [Chryseolinea sp.]HPM30845.1 hypothetical protein [Chryseolinea sp.]